MHDPLVPLQVSNVPTLLSLDTRLTALSAVVIGLDSTVKTLTTDVSVLLPLVPEKDTLLGLGGTVGDLVTNVSGLQGTVTGMGSTIAAVQATVSSLDTTVNGVQVVVSGLQGTVTGLSSTVSNLSIRLNTVEATQNGLLSALCQPLVLGTTLSTLGICPAAGRRLLSAPRRML